MLGNGNICYMAFRPRFFARHRQKAGTHQAAHNRFNAPFGTGSNELWHDIIEQAERGAIIAALEATKGNQTDAAAILNTSRTTLRERIARYNLRGYGVSSLRP